MVKIPIFYNGKIVKEKPTAEEAKSVKAFKQSLKQRPLANDLLAFERASGLPLKQRKIKVGIETGEEGYAASEEEILIPREDMLLSLFDEGGVAHELDHILRQDMLIIHKMRSLIIFSAGFFTSDIARTAENVERIKQTFGSIKAFNKQLETLYPVYAKAEAVAVELKEYIADLGVQSAEDLKALYETSPARWLKLHEILSPITEKDMKKAEDFSQRVVAATLMSKECAQKSSQKEEGGEQVRWDLVPKRFESNFIYPFSWMWRRAEEHLIDKAVIHVVRDPEAVIAGFVKHTKEIDARYSFKNEEERRKAYETRDPAHPYPGTRVKFMKAELAQRRAREQG